MRESMLQMNFFETYYYANVIHNVLCNPINHIRRLNEWHEDRDVALFLQPFPKWTVLHDFSRHVIEELMYETLNDAALDAIAANHRAELWVDRALKHHKIEAMGFHDWLKSRNIGIEEITTDDAHEYHSELWSTGELNALMDQLVNEVFFVLFSNRALLAKLNRYIAGVVSGIDRSELSEENLNLLKKDGVPARASIPAWARRAVYHRDRGMCSACNKDLSGCLSITNAEHFDHIIPLAEGGINDVTNLQLLCDLCNLRKGCQLLQTSERYQAWYSY